MGGNSPWKEAPNGEGSYFDPDAYDHLEQWWTDERVDSIRELDSKLLNEDGTLKWLADGDPPSWWGDIHS